MNQKRLMKKINRFIPLGTVIVALFAAYLKIIEYRIDAAYLSQWNVIDYYNIISSSIKIYDLGVSLIIVMIVSPLIILYNEFWKFNVLAICKVIVQKKILSLHQKRIVRIKQKIDDKTEAVNEEVKQIEQENERIIESVNATAEIIKKLVCRMIIFFILINIVMCLIVSPTASLVGYVIIVLLFVATMVMYHCIIISFRGISIVLNKEKGSSILKAVCTYILEKKSNDFERLLERKYYKDKGLFYFLTVIISCLVFYLCYSPFLGYINANNKNRFGVVEFYNDGKSEYYAVIYSNDEEMITEKCELKDGKVYIVDTDEQLLITNEDRVITYYNKHDEFKLESSK